MIHRGDKVTSYLAVSGIFAFLMKVEGFFWGYLAFVLIILLGGYFTIRARFFQIRALPSILKTFWSFMGRSAVGARGVHPLKVFFASVGGMIGIGNVVGIATAVQIGGPGALVWVWLAALIGSIIKYGEIYLGLTFRVPNDRGGYDGGPMYFLQYAFKNRFIPIFIAFLLCIYGVEIYQFSVVSHSVSSNWGVNRYLVIGLLLGLVLYSSIGGVKRIGKICATTMPGFIVAYLLMGAWVIIQEAGQLPGVLADVFRSAFSGHAAIGGFAGASVLLAIQQGMARASYSADIGIGYDSVIQSESNTVHRERQARLAVLGVFIDNLMCTTSILLVLLTGVWKAENVLVGSDLVQTALSNYFPYMHLFTPALLLIVGYTTMIAYFCVGIKCARFLSPKYGVPIYLIYGVIAFVLFAFVEQSEAMAVMAIVQAMLLITNLLGIFRLRNEIHFQ